MGRKCRTYRPKQTSAYSLLTTFWLTLVSPLGARPHPPGPNALFSMRRYLISGKYMRPSAHLLVHSSVYDM